MTTSNEKSLALAAAPEKDPEWREIVQSIVDDLGDELPDKVILATEYLVSGWPTFKIAKALNVRADTVRGWLSKYPAMAMAVANGRKLMSQWRMARLEQQFVTAVEVSEEILTTPLHGETVDPKVLAAVGLHARYIIGLFAGQQVDINFKLPSEDQTLKAKNDALDYLKKGLQEQSDNGEVIDAVFTPVTDTQKKVVPLLDPEGKSAFGEVGVLDVTAEGALCHICGERHLGIQGHILKAHALRAVEYETVFMLEGGALKDVMKEAKEAAENATSTD